MITVPILMVLLFAIWTLLLLVMTIGVYRWGSVFSGKAKLTDFPSDQVEGSDFYKRAMRAHANCVENLPVFVAIIFAVNATGISSNLINLLSVIVVVARVAQSLIHVSVVQSSKVIFVRFSFFLIQIVCFFCIAYITISTAL